MSLGRREEGRFNDAAHVAHSRYFDIVNDPTKQIVVVHIKHIQVVLLGKTLIAVLTQPAYGGIVPVKLGDSTALGTLCENEILKSHLLSGNDRNFIGAELYNRYVIIIVNLPLIVSFGRISQIIDLFVNPF